MKTNENLILIIKTFIISFLLLYLGMLLTLLLADFIINGFSLFFDGLDPRVFDKKTLLTMLSSSFFIILFIFILLWGIRNSGTKK